MTIQALTLRKSAKQYLREQLNLAAYEANRMNEALRRCRIGKIRVKSSPQEKAA